jgi:hypothetical protein
LTRPVVEVKMKIIERAAYSLPMFVGDVDR